MRTNLNKLLSSYLCDNMREKSQSTKNIPITTNVHGSSKKLVGSKSRNIDLLVKWEHDMYDEREQTRKYPDDLLSSHRNHILEETNVQRDERPSTRSIPITTNIHGLSKKLIERKSRNIDLLVKWEHDMYDEREQTRKYPDDLLSSHRNHILEETNVQRDERPSTISIPITTNIHGLSKKLIERKSRNIDLLVKWEHDMYDEREQTRKYPDDLLSSHRNHILEEINVQRDERPDTKNIPMITNIHGSSKKLDGIKSQSIELLVKREQIRKIPDDLLSSQRHNIREDTNVQRDERPSTKNIPITTNIHGLSKKLVESKSRNIDLLVKWEYDMFDEREQTRKYPDDLLSSHRHNIREETSLESDEWYRNNRHTATVKNTQIWQDTKAEAGRIKVGSGGGQGRHCAGSLINKNEIKSTLSEEYHSKLPTDDTKLPTKLLRKAIDIKQDQDKKNTVTNSTIGPSLKYGPITATSRKYLNSPHNRNDQLKRTIQGFLPLCPSILKFYNHPTRNIIGKKIKNTPVT